jgi:hypothetical protein
VTPGGRAEHPSKWPRRKQRRDAPRFFICGHGSDQGTEERPRGPRLLQVIRIDAPRLLRRVRRGARHHLRHAVALAALALAAAPGTAAAATFTFNPVADTYTSADTPDTNFGTTATVRTDASPAGTAYLRFDVQGLQGTVTKASLRLYAATAGSSSKVDLRSVSSTTWGETAVTYNTQPSVGSGIVSSIGTYSSKTFVEFDATPLVQGSGLVSMALTTPSTTSRSFTSREGTSSNRPQLVVEATDTVAPQVTVSQPEDGAVVGPAPTFNGTAGTTPGDSSAVTVRIYAGSTATGLPVQSVTATQSAGAWSKAVTQPLTTGTYTVQAEQQDTSGNIGRSVPRTFTVDARPPTVFTFAPAADAYTRADAPASNYGSATSLRVDGDAVANSYLRFNVGGLQGMVKKATLRVFSTTSGTTAGVDLRSVASTNWGETSLNFNSAPAIGSSIASHVGAFASGQWVTFDATSLVNGSGPVSMALTTTSTSARTFSSREDPANPPQLVVEASDGVAPAVSLLEPPDGAITADPTPTLSGAAGAAQGDASTVSARIYSGDAPTGTPVQTVTATRSAGLWGAAAEPLADGTYTAQAAQSDAAGNIGFSAPSTFVVDSTGPAVTLDDPADGVGIDDPTPTLSGAAGTAAGDSSTVRVRIYAGGSAAGTPRQTLTATPGSGGWSVTASALPDGVYSAVADQSDGAGNIEVTAPHSFTVDTTAPSPSVTEPAAGVATSDSTPAVRGTAGTATGDSNTVEVRIYGGSSATGSPVQTDTATPSDGEWSLDAAPALADGTYTVEARQADGAGNLGVSAPATFRIDANAAPVVTLRQPVDGAAVSTATPTFRGGAGRAPGDAGSVTVKVRSGGSVTGALVETLTAPIAGDGSWSVAASPALPAGTYTVEAEQLNSASGTGTSAPVTFTVDLTPPDTVIDTGPADPDESTTASFTFHATESPATFQCSVDGAAYATCSSGQDFAGLQDRQHTFAVRAIDRAGNSDATPATFSWNVDTVPPSVTLTEPAAGTSSTVTTPTYRGTAGTAGGDSDSVTVKVYAGNGVSGTPAQTLTASRSSASWSVATTTGLADGTYTAQAEQRDAAGNVGTSAPTTFVVTPAVIAATGDIACDPLSSSFNGGLGSTTSCRQKYTSDLLVGQALDAVLPLGDLQYECSGYNAYLQSYDLSWGRLKPITFPIPGNHEYDASGGTDCDSTGQASGYFRYFGEKAGDPSKGYYSFDIGSWHLIVLNSNDGCTIVLCKTGSAQEQWLKADLAAHPNRCTLASWHSPRYSSATNTNSTLALWKDLYAAGADVILNGHIHNYERFAPQDYNGVADPTNGIREFVVGTGGRSHGAFSTTIAANSEVRDASTYGVLKLTLHADSYDWKFLPEAGKTFTDSGSSACH